MPTTTMPTRNKPVPSNVQPTLFAGKDAPKVLDAAASAKLAEECVGCRLRISGIRMEKGFTAVDREKVAAALNIKSKKRVVGGHHKIYDIGNPTVKEHNDLLNQIHAYWVAMTLPLASVYSEEAAVEGGTRLIRRDQADEFHQRMLAFESQVKTMQAKMNREREGILNAARQMLGDARFDPANYPETFTIDIAWGFPNVSVPSYLEKLAPRAFEHERKLAQARFDRTYELATMDLLEEFKAVIDSWVSALGPVVRIYPLDKHPLAELEGAEVFRIERHADNPQVPEGKMRVLLRYYPKDSKKLDERWVEDLTPAQYADLRPAERPDEKRKFQESTIENMLELVSRFRRLGDTLSSSEEFAAMTRQIEQRLAACKDAKTAATELRNSTVFRQETHKLMQQLSATVTGQMQTFTARRRKVTSLASLK